MFDHLEIDNRRERWLVGALDVLLDAASVVVPGRRHQARTDGPLKILLLRLERIGDLLMTLSAIDRMRSLAPDATIHLVVGSWNAPLAELIPGISSVETLDAPWLIRGGRGTPVQQLLRRAHAWRRREFDLAVNFEPDIRSNALLALSGSARRLGYMSGGGRAFLTDALDYDRNAHTAVNAQRLVERALPDTIGSRTGSTETSSPNEARLVIPAQVEANARTLLGDGPRREPLIGIHVSGGRRIKQWDPDRFATVAARLALIHRAAIVLTGSTDDRPLVDRIRGAIPTDVPVRDIAGHVSLPVLAGVMRQCAVFISGDTGPMHLAAAVGTPVIAIFGPSDPVRYRPWYGHRTEANRARILTAELPCRPCNRIRRPPARCTGSTPNCLRGVTVEAVVAAADDLLRRASSVPPGSIGSST